MAVPRLRPMLPGDVAPATELILAHGWGVRRDWLEFATSSPGCRPLLAELDGEVVGTGVATVNGPVGWLGTIFLAPEWRGQGVGRAITQALLERLDEAGCRTAVLVATREGRRLYERLGFEVQTHYRILEAAGLPADDAAGVEAAATATGPRAFEPADLAAMLRLDAEATGEDRRHALERFAA
ncbi:MAG TPA: GNAT family N-acetyltransferase, partial [Gaiellaceae bacterium]|nr:GNAT family N-acetyltransferase [Gaiellaceae bacterium]